MRIFDSGQIVPGFHVTGPPGIPTYLLDAPQPALFDAGVSAFAQAYIKDIRTTLGDRPPAYLFLTHAHFDHVGAAGVFKQVWPELQVVASTASADILQRANAIELITMLNAGSLSLAREQGFTPLNDAPFAPFQVSQTAAAGRIFDLGGGLSVQTMPSPGHTRDFTSYWIEARKILVASEAVGCEDASKNILPEFLVDIEAYLDNIERFAELDIEILCSGHKLVHTGKEAREHLERSTKATYQYIAIAENFLREEKGDLDAAAQRVKQVEWEPLPWPKQPEQAYLLNTRQRMLKVWERMQAN